MENTTTTQVPGIRIHGLVKRYGATLVLDGIELLVAAGEYFGLVGVNGAGKTTLINALLDFCQVDAGTIQIFGIEHRVTRSRSRLAYLPERFTPPYYLTGRDFLHYMAQLHGTRYDLGSVEQIFSHLDLEPDVLQRPVRDFSKGMVQKLGLAACFLSQRELLILDEPMSGLDPKARALCKAYLLEQKEQGKTVFFTTHLLNDVEALCDRLAILHDGRIRFIGTPDECRQLHQSDNLEQAYLAVISQED